MGKYRDMLKRLDAGRVTVALRLRSRRYLEPGVKLEGVDLKIKARSLSRPGPPWMDQVLRPDFLAMSRTVDAVERLVDQGRLRHGGHPVLKMCVTNAVVTMDLAKNRKFDKSKSGGRIDALVALSMALAVVNKAKPVEIDIDTLIV
jgi:hypothetical protein